MRGRHRHPPPSVPRRRERRRLPAWLLMGPGLWISRLSINKDDMKNDRPSI